MLSKERLMKSRFLLIFGILLILLSVHTSWCQITTSRVDGVVTDASGGVIPAAKVALTNAETQFTDYTMTNESGLYVFPQVPAGGFWISIEAAGFKMAKINGIKVDVNVPRTVDVRLEVGAVTQNVEVSAEIAGVLINAANSEINTVVDRAQIESLPLRGRNPIEFALMQAGVTGRGDSSRDASVNGTRGTYQNLTLDGVNNQDNYIRTASFLGIIPVRESFVEEFNITTSNSDPDAGIGSGQTKIVTRSGGSEYHGEAYYFHQNSALNANNFFNNAAGVPRDPIRDHQYGFNAGGPILKNKMFFFANYEEERNPSSVSVVRTVLTDHARKGFFTYLRPDTGVMETVNLLTLGDSTIDPAIKKIIDLTPAPNDASTGDGTNTGGYRFNSPAKNASKWFSFKIDYNPFANHYVSAVLHQFRHNLPNDPQDGLDSPFPGRPGGGQKSTRYAGSLSWRSAPSPSMTNEARFGAQQAPVDFFTDEKFAAGYQLTFPLIDNPVRNNLANGRNSPVYELGDNLSWVKGNHTFKFGGGIRWTSVDLYNDAGIRPNYTLGFGAGNSDPLRTSMFPGGIDGSDLTRASNLLALLGGYVNQGIQTFNVRSRTSGFIDGQTESRIYSQRFFDLYAGDTWRVNPNISLNLGLRWEYHGVPNETRGLALLPENGVRDILNPDTVFNFVGEGTGREFYRRNYNNFAPVVGLAWHPFSRHSTVIRAGYSISYVNDSSLAAAQNAVYNNEGLSQQVAITGISGSVSNGGIAPISSPEFRVPRTIRDNILLNSTTSIYAIDDNFLTPYVQQWSFSLQQEIFKDTAFEIRYVGNHGTRLARAIDGNQLMLPAEFIEDFRRARRNLIANGNPYTGEQLTIIPRLGYGGLLDWGPDWILNDEIGSYVGDFLAPNRMFFFDGEGGESYGSTLPISYFYKNPNSYVSDYLGNLSFSSYHALQAEIRRRFSKGLSFQLNYTFGKVLTDFSGSQSNFSGYMDNAQPWLERMRPDFDITHTINGNFVYDLPFGRGRHFPMQSKWLDSLVGGWKLGGIVRLRSGEVINIVSQRGTINRSGRSGKNTVNLMGMTIPELQAQTGVFHDSQGRILMFDPSMISPDGTANSAYFTNPDIAMAGTLGLSPISGPWYFGTDMRLAKRFNLPFREGSALEIEASFSNIFNRTNFDITGTPDAVDPDVSIYNAQSINSTSFGLVNSAFLPRAAQLGIKLYF